MHPDLEAVAAADEECRSRLTLAEARREREVATARGQRDSSIEKRRTAALEALERELAAIRSDGDAKLAEIRDQQRLYLENLAKTGDEKLAIAVKTYLSIVCGSEGR